MLREGKPIVAKRNWQSKDGVKVPWRTKDGVDWPTYKELGVDVDNVKAEWHSHWSRSHDLGFSGDDLLNPFNQMNTNRYYSNVNYNHLSPSYSYNTTNEFFRVNDFFMRYFLFPQYVR